MARDGRLGDYSEARAPWRDCCQLPGTLGDDLFLGDIFPACAESLGGLQGLVSPWPTLHLIQVRLLSLVNHFSPFRAHLLN